MTQNSDSDIRSRELASKNGGLAYFFKFEDQEEGHFGPLLALQTASKDVHRLRIIEGLFSMVIPSNMIALTHYTLCG